MSRLPVRARIENEHIRAVVDGYVDSEALRRAEDGVGVRVEVERVRSLVVHRVAVPTFPVEIVDRYMMGEYYEKGAGKRLAQAWLEGSWPCMALPEELRERTVWPPPDAVPLFVEEGRGDG